MLLKRPETEINAEDYYNSSFYFYNASIRCSKVEINSNGIAKSLFISAMSNAAFACELVIKAIYFTINGKGTKGHDLYKLINKLPNNEKNTIYEKLIAISYIDAENMLKEYGDSFTVWRYIFEYETSFQFYKNFLSDLYGILVIVYNMATEAKIDFTNSYLPPDSP